MRQQQPKQWHVWAYHAGEACVRLANHRSKPLDVEQQLELAIDAWHGGPFRAGLACLRRWIERLCDVKRQLVDLWFYYAERRGLVVRREGVLHAINCQRTYLHDPDDKCIEEVSPSWVTRWTH